MVGRNFVEVIEALVFFFFYLG